MSGCEAQDLCRLSGKKFWKDYISIWWMVKELEGRVNESELSTYTSETSARTWSVKRIRLEPGPNPVYNGWEVRKVEGDVRR